MSGAADPTRRFSGRVNDYTRYRPGYPAAIIGVLERGCGLSPVSVVADIGSGTGKLSELFLGFGGTVYGVEPNAEMRREAERLFAGNPRFVSVDGRAEATGLADASADIAVAGQAFHWFDPDRARVEFRRILRGGRFAALIWNKRRNADCALAGAYEEFLREFSSDYLEIEARQTAGASTLAGFFAGGAYGRAVLPNSQVLDREGFRGRYRSCSYALSAGDARFAEAMHRLDAIFAAHAGGGKVTIPYETTVYHGEVGGG
jgi:SAM-dependent methyltransferase